MGVRKERINPIYLSKAVRARQPVGEGGEIQNLDFTFWADGTTYGHVVKPKSFVGIPFIHPKTKKIDL